MDKKHIQTKFMTVAASEEEGRRMGLERGTKGSQLHHQCFLSFQGKKNLKCINTCSFQFVNTWDMLYYSL